MTTSSRHVAERLVTMAEALGYRAGKFTVSGRLTLSGPGGEVTWEDYHREVDVPSRQDAQSLFADTDSLVDRAIRETFTTSKDGSNGR
jgi:hypothetical protein